MYEVGRDVSWREGYDLVAGLAAEPGTRTHAALNEWRFPISRDAIWAQMLTIRVLNALKSGSGPAIKPDWPWGHPVEPEKFTDEDRATARARLRLVSAIPD